MKQTPTLRPNQPFQLRATILSSSSASSLQAAQSHPMLHATRPPDARGVRPDTLYRERTLRRETTRALILAAALVNAVSGAVLLAPVRRIRLHVAGGGRWVSLLEK